jgi:hypothetical protein
MDQPAPRRRVDPEMVVAFCAVLISLSALVVSMVEVRIMREQQRASVWPRIVASVTNTDTFTVTVRNHGIGPALVESAVVTFDGKPEPRWGPVVRGLVGLPEDRFDYPRGYVHSTLNGQVLLPGAAISILRVPPGPGADSASARSGRLGMEVCYCSVYHECWRMADPHLGGSEGSTQRVAPVSKCSDPPERRFEM